MQKTCSKCLESKPLEEFYRVGSDPTKFRPWCKSCTRKSVKNYQSDPKNRDKIRESSRKRYQKNPEYLRGYVKDWDKKNPEYRAEYNRRYAQTVRGRASIIWNKAKRRHKGGSATLVSIEQIQQALETGCCAKSGIRFSFESHDKYSRHPYAPSIDKIDSFGDYTADNVQVVCNAYNQGKNQMSDDEFIEFCRCVVEHNPQRVKTP